MQQPLSAAVRVTSRVRRVLRLLVPDGARRFLGAIRQLPPRARPAYLRWWIVSRARRPAPLPDAATMTTMVFVCHGNIMRSPMAAALLARRLSERRFPQPPRIESAGLHAKPGKSPPDMAFDAASRFAISLDDHEATPLTDEMVRRADVLLAMDLLNAAELTTRWPEAVKKIRLLGPIAPNGQVEIPDPYGTSVNATVACYHEIAKAIEAIALHLVPGAPKSRE